MVSEAHGAVDDRRAVAKHRRWAAGLGASVFCLAAAAAALLVVAAVPRVATADPAPTPSPAPTAAWTVMVYMDGDQDLTPADSNLEPWVTHDIDKEMAAVGSDADVQVVALADRGRPPRMRSTARGPGPASFTSRRA